MQRAVLQPQRSIDQARQLFVVRDDDQRDALIAIEIHQERVHLGAGDGVEVPCGLVGKDDPRRLRDGARDGDALLLTARQLSRFVRQPFSQPDALENALRGSWTLRCERGPLQVAVTLAQAIVRDGEGATKFITVAVEGGRHQAECRAVAQGIAHSPLVKTAFFASDPNLGRIVCAIGNAAARDLDPSRVSFWLDDVLVVEHGGRAPSYREEDGQRVMKQAEITVRVALGRGDAKATVWTCDLSHDYVSINADYRS